VKQAIVDAIQDEDRKYIATSVAGIVFFGTPHRGSSMATWGSMMARIGKKAGFDSHDGIIKDLEKGSTNQIDLLHHFTCWLRRLSVEVVCVIELQNTDYGQKAGLRNLHTELVGYNFVSETSTNRSTGCE
jgi:protein SERAC1